MRDDLPTGTVTFLFTDIEGSTRLLDEIGEERYVAELAAHRAALRDAFAHHRGVEVDTQGDAFFYVFDDASEALAATRDAQTALAGGRMAVRMGLHTGEPRLTGEGYAGRAVHLGARIAAVGHGGQVVLSAATRTALDGSAELSNLGEHRLKDFAEPVWIYQLGSERFPPLKSISNTNLPRPASAFIGREKEVAEIAGRLRDEARLLTLTGPGGTGKTRLSIEAASELVPDFRNGTFWVDLAPLGDPALVPATIAATIGAKEDLASHIGEREMLLVLDNLEQVIEAGADVAELLSACPNLRVLATSRERLRVNAETEYAVPPLATGEALELFRQRSGLEADDTIAELCRRLDNLPLAVELAAARTSVLSPAQILERLAKRLDLLRGGRDAEARQATLRATIEWSHDLLNHDEQRLYGRLAVFAGGWTLDAAEEIAEAEIDVLESLVDKSLVRHEGERFSMLETIRQFALERLEASGEAEKLRQRHARFFLGLAEVRNLSGEDAVRGEQQLEAALPEFDNFRAALEWAAHQDGTLAVRLADALALLWVTNSPAEGRRWLVELLERNADLPAELLARALRTLGSIAYSLGDFAEGTRLYEGALAQFRRLDDEGGVTQMRARLAIEAWRSGDISKARRLAEVVLAFSREHDDAWGEAQALYTLGDVAFADKRVDEAFNLLRQSALIAERIGFRWWQLMALASIAMYALMVNRLSDARTAARESVSLARSIRSRQDIVYGLAHLAWLAAAEGLADRAGRIWGAIEADEERGPIGQWEREREDYLGHLSVVASPQFEQSRIAGRRMSLDEAVRYALEE